MLLTQHPAEHSAEKMHVLTELLDRHTPQTGLSLFGIHCLHRVPQSPYNGEGLPVAPTDVKSAEDVW